MPWLWLLLSCSEPAPPLVPPAASPRSPDLVLISVDTLRADRLSTWGYERETSPELTKLAASSIRYDQAIAPAPWTLPSLASLFTGLFPSGHGVVGPDLGLSPDHVTAAELLGDLGYETAFFGVNAYLEHDHGLSQGFTTWDAHTGLAGRQLVNRVQAFLQQRDPAKPLFLVVHLFEPHCRYRAPDDVHGTFPPQAPGTRLLALADHDRMGACYQLQQADGSPELDLAVYDARYDEEVREVDRLVARLWRLVEPLDPWLGVVADHGEAFWEHGDFGHGRQLFQEQVRVPLLIRPVGGVPGRVESRPTSTLLVAHRLLSTAGVGLEPQELLVALSETDHEGQRLRAVVREDLKLVEDLEAGTVVTYDLGEDPEEQRPVTLAAEEGQRAMAGLFRATGSGPPPVVWRSDPAREEVLEALGYVEPGSPKP